MKLQRGGGGTTYPNTTALLWRIPAMLIHTKLQLKLVYITFEHYNNKAGVTVWRADSSVNHKYTPKAF